MDEAGIDLQVISHGSARRPAHGRRDGRAARARANDRLYEAIAARPDRFAAFATLPTPDPKAAADELERTVTQLGFKGAMVQRADQRRLLRRQALLADLSSGPRRSTCRSTCIRPLRTRPSSRPTTRTISRTFPASSGAAWGFTVETATQAIRLVLSGVFDAFPNLKIILGHMGESLPFSLWRINHGAIAPGQQADRISASSSRSTSTSPPAGISRRPRCSAA